MLQRTSALYVDVREEIQDADIFLWEPSSTYGQLISWASKSPFCHASMAAWVTFANDKRCLLSLETQERVGGIACKVSDRVREFPGKLHWFQAVNGLDRRSVVFSFWREVVGGRYGYWNAFLAALRKMIVFRRLLKPIRDDEYRSPHPPYCSAAIARHMREAGGVDVFPGLADDCTWPVHLSQSEVYRYKCALCVST